MKIHKGSVELYFMKLSNKMAELKEYKKYPERSEIDMRSFVPLPTKLESTLLSMRCPYF